MPRLRSYQYWFMKFPVAEADAEEPRLLSRSWRKVCKSVLLEDAPLVLVVLLDEPSPEAALSAETTSLKSDSSVLRMLSVEEVVDADELSEPVPNCEISCSSLLVKLE